MKYCKSCKLNYDTDLEKCLFCNQTLENHGETEPMFKFAILTKKRHTHFFYRFFIFINIISALVSIYIDYLGGLPLSWSYIVALTHAYVVTMFILMWSASLWISRISKIIVVSILSIILLGLAINDASWAIDYVFPLSIMANMLMLSLIIIFNRKKWFEYFGNLFIISIIGLIPGLLNILRVTVVTWPSAASFTYASVTLLGMIALPSKASREEFKRRFHI